MSSEATADSLVRAAIPEPNAFYEELVNELNCNPITDTLDATIIEKAKAIPLFTLRRPWLRESDDIFESSGLLELVVKYKHSAVIPGEIGLSVLQPWQLKAMAMVRNGPQPTKETLETIAKNLPREQRVTSDKVVVLGAQGSLPGKRYVGLGLDTESNIKVEKDTIKTLDELNALRLHRRGYIGHVSLFVTKNPMIAERLAYELREAVSFPGKLWLDKVKPLPTNLKIRH